MAECAAMLSRPCVPLQRIHSKTNIFIPRNVNVRMQHRDNLLFGKTYLAYGPIRQKIHVDGAPLCTAINGSQCFNESSLKCCCFRALVNPESVVPSSWASYVDEVLLVVSIVLAYVAGAIPQKRAIPRVRSDTMYQDCGATATSSTPYGRYAESNADFNTNDCWGEVKGKLLDAFSAYEHIGLDKKAAISENHGQRCPLSLIALAEGPRLRLLWATLQLLQKEVSGVSQTNEVIGRNVWMVIASEIIKKTIQPACLNWLKEELTLEIGEPGPKLITRISGMLKLEVTVLQIIDRLGKAELYSDLLFFLRFGFLRTECCYDTKFLSQHGVHILEDLVIMLADGIASIYLELISVDSNMSIEINAWGLNLCTLSTRALQRLRNEVALNQWLQQNFESIVSMYEDRFELFVFCRQQLENPLDSQSAKSFWWKKLIFKKSALLPSLTFVQIIPISLPVKRTKELRALMGWRYYFSLFLEFSDITMPLVRTIFTKVSNAISFFLVYMIGRSLGLIFTGIKQSLGWR